MRAALSKKSAARSKARSPVLRVTIDSVLSDDLIRLEVCELRKNRLTFYLKTGEWIPDRGMCLVTPDDYLRTLRIPPYKSGSLAWSDLKEGRVYLIGKFSDLSGKVGKRAFKVNPRNFRIQRVDLLVRKDLEMLYYQAIRGDK